MYRKPIGTSRTTIGDHRRSRGSVDEGVKPAKNVNSVPPVDTVLHAENWDTSLQSVRRIYLDRIRETEDGYPKHGTGISRRKDSVPSVQRLQSSFGTDFLAVRMLQARELLWYEMPAKSLATA